MILHRFERPGDGALVVRNLPRTGHGDVLARYLSSQFLRLFLTNDRGAETAKAAHEIERAGGDPGLSSVYDDGKVIDFLLRTALVADPEITDDSGSGVFGAFVVLLVRVQDVVDGHLTISPLEFNVIPNLPGPDQEVVRDAPLGGEEGSGREVFHDRNQAFTRC